MFTGEYRHSVDDKGRLAVPARCRAQLDDGAFVCKWIDGCLAIFPKSGWDQLAEKVSALPIADADARAFSRFLFASAFEVDLDRQASQWRRGVIPLPTNVSTIRTRCFSARSSNIAGLMNVAEQRIG